MSSVLSASVIVCAGYLLLLSFVSLKPLSFILSINLNILTLTLTLTFWPINSGVLTSLLLPHLSSSLTDSLPSLNLLGYSKTSSRPDCIFEIHQLWQSGFSRVYSNCCCSCSFEPEIIKISQSSHKMYSNNILNSQESTSILNACTKKSGNLLNAPHTSIKLLCYKKCLKDFFLSKTYYLCIWWWGSSCGILESPGIILLLPLLQVSYKLTLMEKST